MKISVTQKHINEGRKNLNNNNCPLALAFQDSGLPVGGLHVYWDRALVSKVVTYPPEVIRFLAALKANEAVEPFTFEVDV